MYGFLTRYITKKFDSIHIAVYRSWMIAFSSLHIHLASGDMQCQWESQEKRGCYGQNCRLLVAHFFFKATSIAEVCNKSNKHIQKQSQCLLPRTNKKAKRRFPLGSLTKRLALIRRCSSEERNHQQYNRPPWPCWTIAVGTLTPTSARTTAALEKSTEKRILLRLVQGKT